MGHSPLSFYYALLLQHYSHKTTFTVCHGNSVPTVWFHGQSLHTIVQGEATTVTSNPERDVCILYYYNNYVLHTLPNALLILYITRKLLVTSGDLATVTFICYTHRLHTLESLMQEINCMYSLLLDSSTRVTNFSIFNGLLPSALTGARAAATIIPIEMKAWTSSA